MKCTATKSANMNFKAILLLALVSVMPAFTVLAGGRHSGTVRSEDAPVFTKLVLRGNAEEVSFKAVGNDCYRAYARLEEGTYSLSGATADGILKLSSLGDGTYKIKTRGKAAEFRVKGSCVARITVDASMRTVDVLPVKMNVRGKAAADNPEIPYKGNGVWEGEVTLKGSPSQQWVDQTMYFALNNTDSLAVKRLRGVSRDRLGMPADGQDTEDIYQNAGTYAIRIDLVNDRYSVTAPTDEYRISVFGSSVANGQGADSYKGYRYLYGELLKDRHKNGESEYPFYTSNVSIGGNTTKNLLDRYDDLTRDFGRYVIFGLSLGNEGIHGASNQEAVFTQWRDNMLSLIAKVRTDGKIPVVMNNYTRGDYNDHDYDYVKRLNLLIHEWDVPSFNCLGSIDNGAGQWADGYMADTYHQNTDGHYEFFTSMVPSLFDALAEGKAAPSRATDKTLSMEPGDTLCFVPEGTCHPFTISVRVEDGEGQIFTVDTSTGKATVYAAADGTVTLTTPNGKTLKSKNKLSVSGKSYVTLTSYYAQKRTLLYVDTTCVGEVGERLGKVLEADVCGSKRDICELFFWRSAMTQEEITALCNGKMLKSSLEIYATLSDEAEVTNKAQSTNQLVFKKYRP